MSKKNEAFENWEEWAKNDWREFYDFFTAKYGVGNFEKVKQEFANQMGLKTEALTLLTNIAIGKGIEYGVSATLGSILTFADFISSCGGYFLYVATRSVYSRQNFHVPNFDAAFYQSDYISDYVKYILYCYPKDLDDGYYGFRYGSYSDGVAGNLRTTKAYR